VNPTAKKTNSRVNPDASHSQASTTATWQALVAVLLHQAKVLAFGKLCLLEVDTVLTR
jgi:hypothetical protein